MTHIYDDFSLIDRWRPEQTECMMEWNMQFSPNVEMLSTAKDNEEKMEYVWTMEYTKIIYIGIFLFYQIIKAINKKYLLK